MEQYDSITTASTLHPDPLAHDVELPDGAWCAVQYTTPPDAVTGRTQGELALVAHTDNSVKRHGLRVANADGKWYMVSETPNGEYTRASVASTANAWDTIFGTSGTNGSWTAVAEDRIDKSTSYSVYPVRLCYIEFDFTMTATTGPGTRYGVEIYWSTGTQDTPGVVDLKTLPAAVTGDTVYYSFLSFTPVGVQVAPQVRLYATDGLGASITANNLKILLC